ncbi:MAG: hypothetical protein WCB51_14045 [Candidatus Dormiibacterota bacterium]
MGDHLRSSVIRASGARVNGICEHPTMLTICIVGDRNPRNETHAASTEAVRHAARHIGVEVDVVWAPTVDITSVDAPVLCHADAVLIAPGSPYRSMDGALCAITHARLHDVPLLGTCGGFQHLVVEYARNVLGVRDAERAESSPDAATHVITSTDCAGAGCCAGTCGSQTSCPRVMSGRSTAPAQQRSHEDAPVETEGPCMRP